MAGWGPGRNRMNIRSFKVSTFASAAVLLLAACGQSEKTKRGNFGPGGSKSHTVCYEGRREDESLYR